MDTLQNIASGFEVVLTPLNLMYVFVGVFLGMIIGVLPGIGGVAGIALLLPLTYYLPPEGSIIMLAGIYYGSIYGGTITSVLLRVPGEASSAVTTFDGYPMAMQGRAGPALGIAAVSSAIGGTVAVVLLSFLAAPLAEFALNFGPPEYVMLAMFGIFLLAYIGSKSMAKTLIPAAFGLLLATVGQDLVESSPRFTFGLVELLGGLELVPIAIGVFGLGEIFYNLERQVSSSIAARVRNVWPSQMDFMDSKGAIFRGTILGSLIGLLPGAGAMVASMTSYGLEKQYSSEPERFGKGAIEGVAGPETANNAAATASFVPLLTLGIPGSAATAVLYGAFLIQDITPGPSLVNENPTVFWGVITSMYIGNLMLLILSIPLIGIFVQMLRVRFGILAPLVVMISMVSIFAVNNSSFDMWILLAFGVLGYAMKKSGFEPGPLVLAFVLGPILEISFRQSMLLSGGGFEIFVMRPISGFLVAVMLLMIAASAVRLVKRSRYR